MTDIKEGTVGDMEGDLMKDMEWDTADGTVVVVAKAVQEAMVRMVMKGEGEEVKSRR